MNPDSSELMKAKRKARSSGRTLCRVFLVGGLIVICVFGLGAAVISYLCVTHKCYLSGRHLVSTAPIGKVLTISQVASQIAPITVPLLMGLLSYQLSAQWLKASETESSNRPSPMQLGLIISLFNSANIPSLLAALHYFLGLGQTSKQKSFSSPSILRRATILLFSFLITAYLISGSDAWLHATSEAVNIKAILPYSTGSMISEPFGRVINGTRCDEAQLLSDQGQASPVYGPSCGQLSSASGGSGIAQTQGILTLSNFSDTHHIEFADDQTAIVVPTQISPNITYTASSIGIKSSCKSVTKDCLPSHGPYGANAGVSFECSREIKLNVSQIDSNTPLDDTGNAVSDSYYIASNPFRVPSIISSFAYYRGSLSYDSFIGSTGWFLHGSGGAWNVLICDIAAVDVTYTYTSLTSSFTIKTSTPSSVRDTRGIVTYGLGGTENPVATAVDGAGFETQITYEEAYALELSRRTIAHGADIYITQNTTDISREEQIIGTKLDLIPFTIMIAMMVTYGCMVLVILILAVITISRTSYVQLASAHLTDPLVTVHAMYGPKDAANTWEDETMKKFGTETNRDRLDIGEFSDDCGGTRFSVQRSDISLKADVEDESALLV